MSSGCNLYEKQLWKEIASQLGYEKRKTMSSSSPLKNVAFLAAAGALAIIAASIFIGISTNLFSYAYNLEILSLLFLALCAGSFGLVGGIMTLRMKTFKLSIVTLLVAFSMGVAYQIDLNSLVERYYVAASYFWNWTGSQGIVLLILSIVLVALSKGEFPESFPRKRSEIDTESQDEEPSVSNRERRQKATEADKFRGYLDKLKKEYEQGKVSKEVYSRLRNEYLTKLREVEEKEF